LPVRPGGAARAAPARAGTPRKSGHAVTLDDWIRTHPFLQPIARMRARIDAAVDTGASATALPAWDAYAEDFAMGAPLLRSFDAAVDLEPAGRRIVGAVDRLASGPAGDPLTEGARALCLELDGVGESPHRLVVDWLLGDDRWMPPAAGLLHCAGWLALSASLRPVLDGFARCATTTAGCDATARRAGRFRRWRSSRAATRAGGGCSRAASARRDGASAGRNAHS